MPVITAKWCQEVKQETIFFHYPSYLDRFVMLTNLMSFSDENDRVATRHDQLLPHCTETATYV